MIRIAEMNGKILVNKTPFFLTTDEDGHAFKATKAVAVEYGWQMLGGTEWHQACKFPRAGIGLQYLRIMYRDELGHPFSFYGFYDGNFFRLKNFELTSRMAAGLAFGLKPYDPTDPLPNEVVGSKVNAFAELGLGLAVRLFDKVYIELGFRFDHFSNGNFKKPQRGINVASWNVGMRYAGTYTEPVRIPLSERMHRHEVLFFVGMAPRQIEYQPCETHDLTFLMANLHLGYLFETTRRIKTGIGADLIYDGTNGQLEAAKSGAFGNEAVPFRDKMGLAVFAGWETAIGRLSVVTELGYMVAQSRFVDSTPPFEQRLGFRYHFFPNFFAGVNVRAYRFRAAKAVEFNVGARKYLTGGSRRRV